MEALEGTTCSLATDFDMVTNCFSSVICWDQYGKIWKVICKDGDLKSFLGGLMTLTYTLSGERSGEQRRAKMSQGNCRLTFMVILIKCECVCA